MKEMADKLGENPISFRRYFRNEKPVIPQIDKLERWSHILGISISEFFLITEPVPWPRALKPHKVIHKKGLSYREALALKNSLRHIAAETEVDLEEISWFLDD